MSIVIERTRFLLMGAEIHLLFAYCLPNVSGQNAGHNYCYVNGEDMSIDQLSNKLITMKL